MSGGIDSGWFCAARRAAWQSRDDQGRPRLPMVTPSKVTWYHEADGVVIPSFTKTGLESLRREHLEKNWDAPLGPLASVFRQRVVDWAAELVVKFQNGGGVITGALGAAANRWDARTQHLPPGEAMVFRRTLTHGLDWPWLDGLPPTQPSRYEGRRMRNHPELHLRPDAVWTTLKKIFSRKSARWWDTKDGRRLPMGMHPIRWVQKGDSEEVRITWNMMGFNKLLDPEAATVTLETAGKLRHRVQRGDLMCGVDLSSSFYHARYSDQAVAWTGAALTTNELPEGVWNTLRREHPEAYCRQDGHDWLVFVLLGVTMGAAPSVRQFTDLMAVPMAAWQRCPVGNEADGTLESWRGTIYIDDLQTFVSGGFGNAVELILRIIAEMVVLGFTINFKPGKSQVVPAHVSRHIGYIWNSLSMRLRLPASRVKKLEAGVVELRRQVRDTRGRPHARAVARLIGLLWSVHMVAHRAVALL